MHKRALAIAVRVQSFLEDETNDAALDLVDFEEIEDHDEHLARLSEIQEEIYKKVIETL